MLYGSPVFARAKVIPDMALQKGGEAYRYASEIGDATLRFLAAGGTALAHADLGDIDQARAWIDRAAAGATRHRGRRRGRRGRDADAPRACGAASVGLGVRGGSLRIACTVGGGSRTPRR